MTLGCVLAMDLDWEKNFRPNSKVVPLVEFKEQLLAIGRHNTTRTTLVLFIGPAANTVFGSRTNRGNRSHSAEGLNHIFSNSSHALIWFVFRTFRKYFLVPFSNNPTSH